MGNNFSYPLLSNSTTDAWTASPLDTCLDRLGVCEGTVSECETRVTILEAELVLLRHPYVIIGLACTVAIFGVVTLLRFCWHLRVGAVAGAFPLDLCPGWVLRRVWRAIRWPFVRDFGQHVGPVAAEGLADVVDQLAVSPADASRFPSIQRRPSAAVPTFRSLPSGCVYGIQRERGSLMSSPVLSRSGSGSLMNRSVPPPPPPPPMPSSVITVFHSAKSRQVAEVSRRCADRPGTPSTKKRLPTTSSAILSSFTPTLTDVSTVLPYIVKEYFFFSFVL
jgi:hypothetical protein